MVTFQLYLSAYLHESTSEIPALHHSQRAYKAAGLMDTQPLDRKDALEIGIRKKKKNKKKKGGTYGSMSRTGCALVSKT